MKPRETTTVPWTEYEMYRVTVRQEALDRDGTQQLARRGVPLLCLGRAKDGSPRHPLMLPSAAALEPWSPS